MLTTSTPSAASARDSLHTLDTLARKSLDELDALYRAAVVPRSMRAVDGNLIGRMLAVRGVPPGFAAPLRRWAASPGFVWDGKTFTSLDDTRGRGINRINVPLLVGRQSMFPFETSFGASQIDDEPALLLDYDLPENPPWVRPIRDEVREVSPGLFFGPAFWRRSLFMWFALDASA